MAQKAPAEGASRSSFGFHPEMKAEEKDDFQEGVALIALEFGFNVSNIPTSVPANFQLSKPGYSG